MNDSDQGDEETISFVEEVDVETNLLPEETAEESDFLNHKRIVDSLLRTVVSNEPGQSIALIGQLGSGKSTIIRLLDDKLDHLRLKHEMRGSTNVTEDSLQTEVRDVRTFSYDAWTHKGESIRRSFIQELGKELKDTEWEPENLKEKVDQVALREASHDTGSSTRLTLLGATAAAIGILIPPMLLLISNVGASSTFPTSVPLIGGLNIARFAGYSLLIMSSFFIVIILIYGIISLLSEDSGGVLVEKKSFTSIDQQTERDKPSTVDFRNSFEGLLKNTLSNPERRLILVVENMDRLPPHEVENAWSMLQTFFDIHDSISSVCLDRTNGEEKKWRNRFWTIVPFSENALPDIVDGRRISGTDFIHKTFQVTQRVRPSVPSDFESYFDGQFEDAFPDLADSNANDQIRELYFLRGKGNTPRAVKRFLNNLTGSVRKWGNTYPVTVQAIHQLLLEIHGAQDLVNSLRNEDRPLKAESLICNVRSQVLRRQLVGLTYGVESGKALQVLYGEDVSEALRDGNAEQLRKLQKEGFEGFEILVRDKVRRIAEHGAHNLIPQAGTALSKLEEKQQKCVTEARDRLVKAIKETETWGSYVEGVGEGLATILRDISHEKYNELAPSLLKCFDSFKEGENYEDWVTTTAPILKAVRERSDPTTEGLKLIENNFRVPKSAGFYMDALAKFYDELEAPNEPEYIIKQDNITPSSLQGELISRISSNHFREEITKSIYMVLSVQEDWKWMETIEHIKSHLDECTTFWVSDNDNVEMIEIPKPSEYAGLIGTLIVLAEREQISEAVNVIRLGRNIVAMRIALHGIELREMEDYPASSAACALALLYIDDQSIHVDSEEPSRVSNESDTNTGNWVLQLGSNEDMEDRINKGINRLDEIVGEPKRNSEIVEKLVELAERAGLKISELATGRNLTSLKKFEK